MSGGNSNGVDTPSIEDQAAADAAAAAQAQAEADAQAQADADAQAASDQAAHDAAIKEASNYLISSGYTDENGNLDPSLAAALADPVDPTNADAAQAALDQVQGTQRTSYLNDVSQYAPDGFEYSSISNTADDQAISDIEAQQRSDASAYLDNLLARGVITQAGYNAGQADLDKQGYSADATLQELGSAALDEGRQSLTDIASQAKTAASNWTIGQNYDPSTYQDQITQTVTDFLAGLSNNIQGRITDGLFSTAGLGAVAGAGQGAQNLAFDPQALAGIYDDTNDPNKTTDPLAALSSF